MIKCNRKFRCDVIIYLTLIVTRYQKIIRVRIINNLYIIYIYTIIYIIVKVRELTLVKIGSFAKDILTLIGETDRYPRCFQL